MGADIQSRKSPVISVRVAGTNTLQSVEVVKYEKGAYAILYKEEPKKDISIFEFADVDFRSDGFYYLRVVQEPEYPGRPWSHSTSEMAWSSPVWVKKMP
jgi:hypothetical protein